LNHLVLEHLSGLKGGCPLEEACYLKLSLFQGVEYFSEVFLCYIDVWFLTTIEEGDQYVSLFKEYLDVFTWNYDDLKDYDKTIFQQIIPLREGEKPVKQKIRMMNPKLKPLVKVELEKLKKDGIIYPIRHSD
jgi:hypothetical protein